jgi:hypothetical protein
LHEDVERRLATFGQKRKIPNFALETDIGDQAAHVLWINAWGVRGIRIAIGIAIFAVEEKNEVVTIVHICFSFRCGFADFGLARQ